MVYFFFFNGMRRLVLPKAVFSVSQKQSDQFVFK